MARPPIIAINARYLSAEKLDGIGWFTHETVSWMAQHAPNVQFHLLVSGPLPPSFPQLSNVTVQRIGPPTKHAALNLLWFEWSVARALHRIRPALFVSLDGILTNGWRGPQYAVIHDLNFMHIPDDFKWSNRVYYRWAFPQAAKLAARIGTVSEYSKADIVKTFGVPAEKIDVVYSASKSDYRPVSLEQQNATRARLTGGAPYFIFVGTLTPRKNILRLMQAFERYKEITGGPEKLVLAGWEMYRGDGLRAQQRAMQHGADVIFTGRVAQEDLNDFIGSAVAMTFVSYFEGFGVPPLEAMACGVPVVASTATSIPEIVGDAAVLADPYDVEAIAAAMTQVATDASLRESLIQRGFRRYMHFTWPAVAEALWTGMRRCLSEAGVEIIRT